MDTAEWKNLARRSAAPERVQKYLDELKLTSGRDLPRELTPDLAHILSSLFSGSKSMSELLLQKPAWLEVLDPEGLSRPRQLNGLWREINQWLAPALARQDYSGALSLVRDFKQKEMLRIAARDLARLGHVSQITEEISNVADVCVEVVYRVALQQLTGKFGQPYTQELTGEWEPATFCILGMGKLGGQELNYSSDIDVLFVYNGEGDVFKTPPGKKPGPKTLSNHQFFNRLSEAIIAEVTRMTDQRALFRIDLRLRPEGKTGPLSRSLGSYESYYFQWGQTWERMMLIKARCMAGDKVLGAEFMDMVQPFRYPRTISGQLPREVAAMKQRIETEVVRSGELERNVKLGRGGIREIEFVAQTLQVLHGGRLPFLQTSKTLIALDKINAYHLLEENETESLKEAYCFLRDLEHRIQMEEERQTHTIPTSSEARTRLARLMGFDTLEQFEKQLKSHTDFVRSVYDRRLGDARESGPDKGLKPDFAENPQTWKDLLALHSFREPDRGVQLMKEFVLGPGFGHISGRTTELALQLVTTFLAICPKKSAPPPNELWLSDPDRVLARLDSFVAAYGARALLYETWASNRSLFKLLLLLFDRSEYLAELAIRVPDLVEEIEQTGQLRRRKTREQILEDLRAGMDDTDQHTWLRRYYHAEQMRLGLRDILGLTDAEQIQTELTALAEAFLIYALEVVIRKHKLRKPPFAILGLGKLGGAELIYASDLDIVFVAPTSSKNLPKLQKVAQEIMELLSKRTEHGATFEMDARLRPDGEKGLLVNTVKGYTDYYQKRAMLWEVQSLSRIRPITGDEKVIAEFEKLVPLVTDFSTNAPTAAYTADWKQEIHRMRMRIEKERTAAGKDQLAIKTGRGGLMDGEFVAQALCLENGWREPNTLHALKRAAKEKRLPENTAAALVGSYFKLMEYERILRRWSFEPESVLPDTPPPMYRVAVRCGFETTGQFLQAVDKYRDEMRRAYLKYFQPD